MVHIKQTKWTTYNMFLQVFLKDNSSLICNVTYIYIYIYIWHWAFMIHFSCYVTLGVYFSIKKIYIFFYNWFLLNNIFFSVYLLFHNIFKDHATVTITFHNNSFVTYQNYTFSGIWFNQNFFDLVFFTTQKCANGIKINNYLTLETNMLNMHIDLLKYALKWAAENIYH